MVNRSARPGWGWALTATGICVSLLVALAVSAALARASAGSGDGGSGSGSEDGVAAYGNTEQPENVIVMISDGMGFNQADAASMYEHGTSYYQPGEKTPSQVYQKYPVETRMSTYSEGDEPEDGEQPDETGYDPERAASDFEYVGEDYTDSAAAGTALAAGEKNYNGQINYSTDDEELRHVFEAAAESGKATGTATSVPISHATPAAFGSHNEDRGNYEEIFQEMAASELDVMMGAGNPDYDEDGDTYPDSYIEDDNYRYSYVGGPETWEELQAGEVGGDDPWHLVEDRADFQAMANGEASGERIAGVPKVPETLQSDRDGDPSAEPYATPLRSYVPTLEEMSLASLNALDSRSEEGMALMIEGGAVDWASQDNHTGRMIEEQIDFNNSVEAVNEWVETNSSWDETLVIVTADHEAGYLAGPGSGEGQGAYGLPGGQQPLVNNGAGVEPGTDWFARGHTNQLVPLYAKGPGAQAFRERSDEEDVVWGPYMDNTDHAEILFDLFEE